jgi:hypothetical protein
MDLLKTNVLKKVAIAQHSATAAPTSSAIWDQARKIWSTSGAVGFYRGIQATLVRACPIHALNFFIYETVLKFCMQHST